MNQYKKLGKQTLIYGLGTIVPRFLNFTILSLVYYTHVFKPKQYGIITELYAYNAIFLILLSLGFETGLFRISKENNKDEVFSTASIFIGLISTIFIVLTFLFTSEVADLLQYKSSSWFLRWLFLIIGIDSVSNIFIAKLRNDEKPKKFAVIQLINVAVIIISVYILIEYISVEKFNNNFLGYQISEKVEFVFIANFIGSFVKIILLGSELKGIKIRLNYKILKSLLIFSLPLLFAQLAGIINETLDKVIFKHIYKNENFALYELGIYGANYRIAVIMSLFIMMFRYAAEPFFFNLYKSKDDKKIYSETLNYFIVFCLIIFLGSIYYLDILKLLIDKKFYSGLLIVPIILFSYILNGILFNINIWFKLKKLTYFSIIIAGSGALITISGNIILIPKISYVGCAITHVIAYVVMISISLLLGRRYYKINYNFNKIGLYFGIAGIFYCLSFLTNNFNLVIELIVNTLLLFLFVLFIEKREGLVKIFLKK